LSPQEELPTRLVAVPKTQATPRLIAEEPTVMQYIQQAIMQSLVPEIESNLISGSFTGFTDQAPNQLLARKGSEDGSLATLDLSEASDRVANWLVEELFGDFPNFFGRYPSMPINAMSVTFWRGNPSSEVCVHGLCLDIPN